MKRTNFGPKLGAWLLVVGLGASGILLATPTTVHAAQSAHTVPLDCSADGGDQRTAAEASVQPSVIVATPESFGPTTYQAYGIDDSGHLQPIGNVNEEVTTDHLVAGWQNRTNCFGSDISRNAWIADATGHVFGEGDFSGPPANNFGDASGLPLNQPVVGMTPTTDANGYWLVAADGGIFSYGDASFHGSTGAIRLNEPIVGMSVSQSGNGYTLVATDGGVFSFGDAQFYGSIPGLLGPGRSLNKPIEGIVTTPDGGGYWMVASDGGVFNFGDAPFLGSLGGQRLSAPIAGMFANGNGYTLVGEDGTLYPFT